MKDAESYHSYFTQRFPVGSARKEIEEFLKTEHMEYSFNPDDSTTYAIVRGKTGMGFTITGFQFKFQFDAGDKLKMIVVKQYYTGP